VKNIVLISLLLLSFLLTNLIPGCSNATQSVETTNTYQMTTANPVTTTPHISNTQTITTQTNPVVTTIIPTTVNNNGAASFTVSDLHIEPEVVAADDFFSIVFTVKNTGSEEGIYDAAIDIIQISGKNRIEIGTLNKSVMVTAGESKVVTYDELHLPEGDYEAVIDGLSLLFFCT